jgi:hypothetical protein
MIVIFKLDMDNNLDFAGKENAPSLSGINFEFVKECSYAEFCLRKLDSKIFGGNMQLAGWCIYVDGKNEEAFFAIDLEEDIKDSALKSIVREYKLNKIL